MVVVVGCISASGVGIGFVLVVSTAVHQYSDQYRNVFCRPKVGSSLSWHIGWSLLKRYGEMLELYLPVSGFCK